MKKINQLLVTQAINTAKCTGCGACKNICPVNAIQFVEDKEGFLFPQIKLNICIHCYKCESVCPVLHPSYNNSVEPTIFAIHAEDNIRSQSSSGGMFTLAAHTVLKKCGIVCGAAFDRHMVLRHQIITTNKNLSKLRGSKYVQSNTGFVFRAIKNALQNKNIPVLFIGTPCQVSGLKAYLRESPTNLYTIDLMCHGVPSQKLFSRYLTEIAKGRKIQNIFFRDKKYGWTSLNILISFTDGSSYEGTIKTDPYEKGFHANLFLRKSCSDCPFAILPRQGDLTIGDFWGIEAFLPSFADAKGTSLVCINNEHGKHLFNESVSDAILSQELTCKWSELRNRTTSIYKSHDYRTRFFDLINLKALKDAVNNCIEEIYDVGLVGIYTVPNFGGAITYLALYHVLIDMGFSTLMIERPANAKVKVGDLSCNYKISPYPKYSLAPIYETKESMRVLNQKCSTFLVGSDQLFNDFLYTDMGKWITLDWVSDNKKKIAYAASFGHDFIWSSEETRAEMAYFMEKFDGFSVREKSGVILARKEFRIDAEWVLDPVFLCEKKHYINLISIAPKETTTKYIGAYILDPNQEKEKIICYVTKKFLYPYEIYSEMHYTSEEISSLWNLPVTNGKIEARLSSIANSTFFITDSFHGVCFCLLFQKDFIVIVNKKRGATRFISLLSHLGLSERIIETFNDLQEKLNILKPIDYEYVSRIIYYEKVRCLSWLQNALSNTIKKPYSTNDVFLKQLQSQNKNIDFIANKYECINHKINFLLQKIGYNLCLIDDILLYLSSLKEKKEKYIICISVKDTPGYELSNTIAQKLFALGLKINLQDKHWHSYLALIDSGKVISEHISDMYEPIESSSYINNIKIKIISQSYKRGNKAMISFDGIEYAVNARGINIVVYDKEKKEVIDSLAFDTHTKEAKCKRLYNW